MKEIEQVAAALDRQDYRGAAKLLKQLQKQSPQNPWVKLYIGRWYEATDQLESAEKVYRKLLQTASHPKIIGRAREGVKRLEAVERQRRQDAIAQTKADPRSGEPAVLILEPVEPERKPAVANILARLLKTDAYSARMQLQSRGWRLYRTGELGELGVYGREMLDADIPVFWASLADIDSLHVFRVSHVQSLSPQPAVVCRDETDRLGALSFDWSEVAARVEGLLPLFVETMDYDPRRQKSDRFRHRKITQDYAKIYDLHLPGRRSILRFCDQTYEFQKGVQFNPDAAADAPTSPTGQTARLQWNRLVETFDFNLETAPLWSEFTPFAETTLDYTQLLGRISSHIDLDRKTETPWDPAFQLYSGLVYWRGNG